jgi:uncharacterized protein with NAD-binding domain and iron-sulfur cluster
MNRQKVAIIGGGMAGLAAAFELTATEELRAQYEVTVHQLGWRLGGKCATGRNRALADRIEEHGMHLWYGGYDNAFEMLRRTFDELDPIAPPEKVIRKIDDAFRPLSYGVLYDYYDRAWHHSVIAVPTNSGHPGDRVQAPELLELVETAIDTIVLAIESIQGHVVPPRPHWKLAGHVPSWARRVVGELETGLYWLGNEAESGLLFVAKEFVHMLRTTGTGGISHHPHICRMLEEFREWLWTNHAEPNLNETHTRHLFSTVDVYISMVIGILNERLIDVGFDQANDVDLRTWMSRHGAKDITLDGPLMRSVYDQAFAQKLGPTVLQLEGGEVYAVDEHDDAATAAGAMLVVLVRNYLSYQGALIWKPTAGLADVVVSPMYRVLMARGVTFEFFHRVDALHLSDDKTRIASVDVTVQATTATGQPYDPIYDVKGVDCWPSEPFWEQLEGGDGATLHAVDFEAGAVAPTTSTKTTQPTTLRDGVDYDWVILAASAAALPPMCKELLDDTDHPGLRDMLAHTNTVMTQAFQIWSNRTVAELGWKHPGTVASCFIEPLDTYCDMTDLLPRESWTPEDDVRSLGFFCGVLEDRHEDSQSLANGRARDATVDYLGAHMQDQWPKARTDTNEFDWSVLVDHDDQTGEARLDSQYVRANYTLTERYVQTAPGSVVHRLAPHESGYANLVLAGDWVRTGMDIGCVEGAIIGGRLASRAVCGSPQYIHWEDLRS